MINETKIVPDEISSLKSSIKDIQIVLENETNRNVAEHMVLSRKLDEVLKANREQEMLPIRVSSLEKEVRRLKERVEAIA